jgi:hypothetical protein
MLVRIRAKEMVRMPVLKRRDLAKLLSALLLIPAEAGAEPAVPEDATWTLLAPVHQGTEIGFGWTLAELSAPRRGAVTLLLVHAGSGRTARVDICRHGGHPAGVAATSSLDFILMNGSQGADPTDEELGRALRALAASIEGPAAASTDHLLSHDERTARHGVEPSAEHDTRRA